MTKSISAELFTARCENAGLLRVPVDHEMFEHKRFLMKTESGVRAYAPTAFPTIRILTLGDSLAYSGEYVLHHPPARGEISLAYAALLFDPGPLINDDDYATAGAGLCPFCRGTDIEGGEVSIEGRLARQDAYCGQCQSEWEDIYTLAGYNVIESP